MKDQLSEYFVNVVDHILSLAVTVYIDITFFFFMNQEYIWLALEFNYSLCAFISLIKCKYVGLWHMHIFLSECIIIC